MIQNIVPSQRVRNLSSWQIQLHFTKTSRSHDLVERENNRPALILCGGCSQNVCGPSHVDLAQHGANPFDGGKGDTYHFRERYQRWQFSTAIAGQRIFQIHIPLHNQFHHSLRRVRCVNVRMVAIGSFQGARVCPLCTLRNYKLCSTIPLWEAHIQEGKVNMICHLCKLPYVYLSHAAQARTDQSSMMMKMDSLLYPPPFLPGERGGGEGALRQPYWVYPTGPSWGTAAGLGSCWIVCLQQISSSAPACLKNWAIPLRLATLWQTPSP